jgi:hypothetical protein
MTFGAHRRAHEIHLCEIDGIQISNRVLDRLEVHFWILTLHS